VNSSWHSRHGKACFLLAIEDFYSELAPSLESVSVPSHPIQGAEVCVLEFQESPERLPSVCIGIMPKRICCKASLLHHASGCQMEPEEIFWCIYQEATYNFQERMQALGD
jgi:hypothetical protein